jgi:hypothetical protein
LLNACSPGPTAEEAKSTWDNLRVGGHSLIGGPPDSD